MSYNSVKRGIDKLEQRIHGSQKAPEIIIVKFSTDTEHLHVDVQEKLAAGHRSPIRYIDEDGQKCLYFGGS